MQFNKKTSLGKTNIVGLIIKAKANFIISLRNDVLELVFLVNCI